MPQEKDHAVAHVVKAFLPCDIHHALHALLIVQHETWQEWIQRKAEEELEYQETESLND